MNLQYGGRPVSWFGVGAPDDVVNAGIAAFQGKAMQLGGSGGFSPPPPNIAVAGLKAAGTAAVNTVGPAIDTLSGNDPAVMKLTQQVWQLNRDQLAAVDGREGIGQADVDKAKGIVDQMLFDYKQAANLASSLVPKTASDAVQVTTASRVNIASASAPNSRRTPMPTPRSVTAPPVPAVPPAPAPPPPANDGNNTATWIAVGIGVFALVVGGGFALSGTRRVA